MALSRSMLRTAGSPAGQDSLRVPRRRIGRSDGSLPRIGGVKFIVRSLLVLLVLAGLAACDSSSASKASSSSGGSSPSASSGASAGNSSDAAASLSTNVNNDQTNVPVNTRLSVKASDGKIDSVKVASADGRTTVPGATSGTTWTASDLLEPGVTYTLDASATGTNGKTTSKTVKFTSQSLTLQQQTYATISPTSGTFGVAMPIIVTFDVPIKDKAAFQRQMTVTSTPAQEGSWNWISDTVAHWRPKNYWQPGTKVHVSIAVNGVAAGNGIYGQSSKRADFTIGSSTTSVVDVNKHTLTVTESGKVVKVIPVTTGQPGMASREGIKVIMEKYVTKDMDSATVGYPKGSANYYNLKNVQYAMRLTNSGEFVHAAPWSVWAQGKENVSHACVGMSVANAGWFFGQSKIGDPIKFVGSTRALEANNGWTDWNVPWSTWVKGSAL